MYYTLKVKDNEYKARLTAKACVDLEKRLGTNPMNILISIGNDNKMPNLDTLLVILHASLQALNHGITMDDTYKLYDEFVDEGHTVMDLFPAIIDIFKVSGLIPEEQEEKN